MKCGTVRADNDKEAQDVAEFRNLLTDSLSKANVITWTLPDSLEPHAKMNFYLGV